jgi:tetratricopeptide (TPR) repeat protein
MNKRRAYCCILVLSVVFSLAAVVPRQALAQTKKGIELYDSWQYREAESVLREALKADPSDVAARYYLGLCMLLQEKYGDALDVFLKVKQSQDRADQRTRPSVPNEYQIQLALARARLGLKQYADAWKNLESARIKDGNSSDVYVYRGVFYLQQEKNPEAIKELQKAIRLDEKNGYAYYYEGLAYFHSGQADKAVSALKTFLQLAPYAPEAAKAKKIIDQLC